MGAFARWIGGLTAAGAALLAAVWLIEAMPPGETARRDMQLGCRTVAAQLQSEAVARRDVIGAEVAAAQMRACFTLGQGWDQPLLTRGLVAAGAAVALLLLAAMVPAGGEAARAGEERRREAALEMLMADEKRRALAQHGSPITDLEARIRAQKRLRDSAHG